MILKYVKYKFLNNMLHFSVFIKVGFFYYIKPACSILKIVSKLSSLSIVERKIVIV